MSVYLISFTISALLLKAANAMKKNQRWIFIVAALLIPCFVAGMRGENIGTDVRVYLSPMTKAAIHASGFSEYMRSSWIAAWADRRVSDYEIGFSFVVYLVARLFRNIYAVQFAIQGLSVGPICCALYKNTKIDHHLCWLGILTYYLMFFNVTLNMMRQSIAMAFTFLAFTFFVNGEKKKCCLFTGVAMLFHTSAILGALVYALYEYVNAESGIRFRLGSKTISGRYANMMTAVIVGLIVVAAGTGMISGILNMMGLSKYVVYIRGTIEFMPNQVISRLPAFALLLYAWKKSGDFDDFRFYFTMMFFDLLMAQFTSVNPYAGRIGMYFSQFEILAFPCIYHKTKKNKVILALLMGYMLFYWWFYNVAKGANATVPYVMGYGK